MREVQPLAAEAQLFSSLHRSMICCSRGTSSSAGPRSLHDPPCQNPETQNVAKLAELFYSKFNENVFFYGCHRQPFGYAEGHCSPAETLEI